MEYKRRLIGADILVKCSKNSRIATYIEEDELKIVLMVNAFKIIFPSHLC